MMIYDISIVFSSFLFWVIIDRVSLFKNDKIVNSSLIHSIITGIGGNVCCALYPMIIYDYQLVKDTLPFTVRVVPLIFTGYSVYDFYLGIKTMEMEYIFHGLIFIYGCNSAYTQSIMPTLNVVTLMETSSIFLNIRPLKQPWIDVLFVITFFLYRIIIFPTLITIYILNDKQMGRGNVFIGGTLITALNVYWFYYIMQKAVKQLKINN